MPWSANLRFSITPDDVCFSVSRLFFSYGLANSMYIPLLAGASVVLMPMRPEPERIFELKDNKLRGLNVVLDGKVLANGGEAVPAHHRGGHLAALRGETEAAVVEEFDVYVGGDVEVADYKTTGTDELGEEVAKRVGDRSAVLMANHGLFAVGKNPADVMHIAGLVERTAEIVWGAQRLGEVGQVAHAAADEQAFGHCLLLCRRVSR